MGPLWDFDVTFGNNTNPTMCNVDGFVSQSTWFYRLLEDPAFVKRVKERFTYFYNHCDDYLVFINNTAEYLKYTVEENDKTWPTFYQKGFANYDVWGNYQNEVILLKKWLVERLEWMSNYYSNQ